MDQDSYLLVMMHRIVNQLDRKTLVQCKLHGLTLGQFGVLEALRNKGDLTVGQVKAAILSSDGTIPVIVKNLENRNLIRKMDDPEDGRKCILTITAEGRKLVDAVYPKSAAVVQAEFAVWSEAEKTQLARLLSKFHREN